MVYIGKLNNKEMMAGVGLGNMTAGLFGVALIGGFN